ncbi:type IV toxin-antitoxin system AbiEi family antitoxin domain-containing protein [Nocardioides ferulae]|uniref:type IV toxin-antitoxin system AbiEi family antitoxin domain-containing protein n=1 Tax=Nocardioides ferulae TaxID=2340821 RepID=UPI0013DDBF12|nr:type IV toxin-antitoxin system AbiEi family antitoxin domain-containing protein [Nocardioides ferulae]
MALSLFWLGELPAPPDAHPNLPFDRPFSLAQARATGVTSNQLTRLVRSGLLRRVIPGVYVDSAVPDTHRVRAQAVSLVVPPGAIIVDESAAWIHGIDVDPPWSRVVAPRVQVFQQPGGTRIRKAACGGGERTLLPSDVCVVEGARVLTPLRLACDLGRLRQRDPAMAAIDALLRASIRGSLPWASFTHEELSAALPRFRGMRGVVQLRDLVPRADPRAESPRESVVRIRCQDGGLPALEPQVEVLRGRVHGEGTAYLDLANRQLMFGVEYNGDEFHGAEQQEDDRRRLGWLTDQGWGIVVLDARHVTTDRDGTAAVVRDALTRHLRGERGPFL